MASVCLTKQFDAHINKLKTLCLGAKNKLVTVENFQSSKLPTVEEHSFSNVFDVTINIAGNIKTWQIIYDIENSNYYPDIVFTAEDDSFLPDIQSLSSFCNWDPCSEDSLYNLIKDLHDLYINHQHILLQEYPQLLQSFEELVLLTECGSNCEIDIKKKGPGTYNDTVQLLLPIEVDFSSLPPYLKMTNPGEHSCCLSILYEAPNLMTLTPVLELSPGVENAFGGISNLRIPSFGTSTLTTYVKNIHHLLNNTVEEVCSKYEKRKSLMLSLSSLLYGALLEYDANTYFETSFLLEINDFHFILYVILPDKFPSVQPLLFVQSIYHTRKATASTYRTSIKDFPYNVDWDSGDIIYNIKTYLIEHMEKIKTTLLAKN